MDSFYQILSASAVVLAAAVPIYISRKNAKRERVALYREKAIDVILNLMADLLATEKKPERKDRDLEKKVTGVAYNKDILQFKMVASSRAVKAYMNLIESFVKEIGDTPEEKLEPVNKMLKALRREMIGINWFNARSESLSLLRDKFQEVWKAEAPEPPPSH